MLFMMLITVCFHDIDNALFAYCEYGFRLHVAGGTTDGLHSTSSVRRNNKLSVFYGESSMELPWQQPLIKECY